jgi:DNA-directed RNA polymerase specialized sigma24 family protein
MTLKGLEYWVLAQVGLEVLLVLLLLFSLLKIRSLGKLLKASQKEEVTAKGTLEKFSEQLAAMENKRVALEEALGLLNEKAQNSQAQNPSPRAAASRSYNSFSPQPRGASLRLQVEDLHLQGFSSAEIAQRLSLHPTEVKMALDLARLKAE